MSIFFYNTKNREYILLRESYICRDNYALPIFQEGRFHLRSLSRIFPGLRLVAELLFPNLEIFRDSAYPSASKDALVPPRPSNVPASIPPFFRLPFSLPLGDLHTSINSSTTR